MDALTFRLSAADVRTQESLLPEPVVDALVSRLRDGFTNQDELGRSILVTAEAEGSITHARPLRLVLAEVGLGRQRRVFDLVVGAGR